MAALLHCDAAVYVASSCCLPGCGKTWRVVQQYACHLYVVQVERGLRVKAEADAKGARGVERDQAATMESLQEESEVNKAVAKKVSLLADQLAATKSSSQTPYTMLR